MPHISTLPCYPLPPDPFVFQSSIGCELQSNGTIRTFFDIAYEGQNFLRFNLDAGTWDQMQHNQLSAKAEHLMANASTLNEVIQVLLNDTCVDILRLFIQAGKADLERQGELTLTLPHQLPTWGLSSAALQSPCFHPPVPPMAVVFARTAGQAQLLLVCRVTSFYPRPIAVTWLRDGREVPPSPALSTGTVLPNADLTYQLRSTLLVSPQDGHSYACRVQHCSLGDRSLLVPWGKGWVWHMGWPGAATRSRLTSALSPFKKTPVHLPLLASPSPYCSLLPSSLGEFGGGDAGEGSGCGV